MIGGTLLAGAAGFFFDTRLGKGVAIAAVAIGLVAWFAYDQRARGAASATAKIERTNVQAVQKAAGARARSVAPGSDGVRDPYTRAD